MDPFNMVKNFYIEVWSPMDYNNINEFKKPSQIQNLG
jgi:hypothetical protein